MQNTTQNIPDMSQQDFEHILWCLFNAFVICKQRKIIKITEESQYDDSCYSDGYRVNINPLNTEFKIYFTDKTHFFTAFFDWDPHYEQGELFHYKIKKITINCTGQEITIDCNKYRRYTEDAVIPACKLEYELTRPNSSVWFPATQYGRHYLSQADSYTNPQTRKILTFLRDIISTSQPKETLPQKEIPTKQPKIRIFVFLQEIMHKR